MWETYEVLRKDIISLIPVALFGKSDEQVPPLVCVCVRNFWIFLDLTAQICAAGARHRHSLAVLLLSRFLRLLILSFQHFM